MAPNEVMERVSTDAEVMRLRRRVMELETALAEALGTLGSFDCHHDVFASLRAVLRGGTP